MQSLTNPVMGSLHSGIQLSGLESSYSSTPSFEINPLNPELNPTCQLLTLLEAHHILHVSRIRVKNSLNYTSTEGDSMVVWSKARVCGSAVAGIVGSNPADNIDVSLL